jgi:hypothetical protein
LDGIALLTEAAVGPSLRAVDRGLRLNRVGFRVVTACVLFAPAAYLIGFVTHSAVDWLTQPLVILLTEGALVLSGCAAVVGLLVGVVGRCCCLAAPPEFPTARGRIRLAVLLEVCGWLSGLTNAGVWAATAMLWIVVPDAVLLAAGGLSLPLLVAGWGTFLKYLESVGELVGDRPLARRADLTLLLFVSVLFASVFGAFLIVCPTAPASYDFFLTTGGSLLLSAGGVGLFGLGVYGGLLRGLYQAVRRFADQHPEGTDDLAT